MRTDLVFPKGNEKKMLAMAKRLGVQRLFLCYSLSDARRMKEEVANMSGKGLAVELAVLVSQKDVQRAKAVTKFVVARGKPGIYEDKRVRFVIDFESGKRDDFIHHRNSGLTQVFIKKGMATGKTFLVNARQLGENEETILGRMQQNNRFFRKYKPDVLVVSGARTPLEMRNPRDLQQLLLV